MDLYVQGFLVLCATAGQVVCFEAFSVTLIRVGNRLFKRKEEKKYFECCALTVVQILCCSCTCDCSVSEVPDETLSSAASTKLICPSFEKTKGVCLTRPGDITAY